MANWLHLDNQSINLDRVAVIERNGAGQLTLCCGDLPGDDPWLILEERHLPAIVAAIGREAEDFAEAP